MKKIFICGLLLIACVTSYAQGSIDLMNRNIGKIGDLSHVYSVPIYAPGGRATGAGAGLLPGGVMLGLFLANSPNSAAPLAALPLRTDDPFRAQFVVGAIQTAFVPGVPAGQRTQLEVRIWQGVTLSYAEAVASTHAMKMLFTTEPLGGTPLDGGQPVTTPGMTGWGPESGEGIEFVPEPMTIALFAIGSGILLMMNRRMSSFGKAIHKSGNQS